MFLLVSKFKIIIGMPWNAMPCTVGSKKANKNITKESDGFRNHSTFIPSKSLPCT